MARKKIQTAGKAAAKPETFLEKAVSEITEKAPAEKASVKKAAAKRPGKRAAIKTGISVQYMGKDISDKDMTALVKKDWTAKKNKIGDIKTMELYVKVEENKVYYVINGTETGSVEI